MNTITVSDLASRAITMVVEEEYGITSNDALYDIRVSHLLAARDLVKATYALQMGKYGHLPIEEYSDQLTSPAQRDFLKRLIREYWAPEWGIKPSV